MIPLPAVPDDDDFEPPPPTAWGDEIDWATRGQFGPLVRSLRAGKPIGDNDGELYCLLAELIGGQFRRGKGKPPEYEKWTFGQVGPDLSRDVCRVKKSYAALCSRAAFVWHRKAELQRKGTRAGDALAGAIEKAQLEFRLTEKQQDDLEKWLARSTGERRRLAEFPIDRGAAPK